MKKKNGLCLLFIISQIVYKEHTAINIQCLLALLIIHCASNADSLGCIKAFHVSRERKL